MQTRMPDSDLMYDAVVRRDADYDGVFFTAVRTTGIFCRPACPARKPLRENVEFFPTTRDALFAGYRPCLRCRPLEPAGSTPDWLRPLLELVDARSDRRWTDRELRDRGFEPSRVRRWFKAEHGMTFHAYQRGLRMSHAIGSLRDGAPITRAAFETGYESLSGFYDAFRRIIGDAPGRARNGRVLHITRLLTPLGPMIAASGPDGVALLEFSDRRMLERQLRRIARRMQCAWVPGRTDLLDLLDTRLQEYFAGNRRSFDLPLDLVGSDFQRLVWNGLLTIPWGETRSYAEQAAAIGRPDAVRAVARANGENALAILVPCHRVIGADGSLTGYGGGLWRKQRLLDLERSQLSLI